MSDLKVKLNVKVKRKKSTVKESEKLDSVPQNDHSKGESDHNGTEDLLSDIFDNPSSMSDSTRDQNSSRSIVCKKTSRRTAKRKKSPWKKLVVEKRTTMSGSEESDEDDSRDSKSSKRKHENTRADKERRTKKRKQSKSQISRKVVFVNSEPIIISDNDDIQFGTIVISDEDSEGYTAPTANSRDQSKESRLNRNSGTSLQTKVKRMLAEMSEERQDDAPSTSGSRNVQNQNGASRDAAGSQEDWVVITTADETIDDDPPVRKVISHRKSSSSSKRKGKINSSQLFVCSFELIN